MGQTPVSGVRVVTCPAHAGMVSRDHLDTALAAIEARIHKDLDANQAAIDVERRRIDVIIGPRDGSGKINLQDHRIRHLEEIEKRFSWLAVKIAVASVAAGGGVPYLLRALGVTP